MKNIMKNKVLIIFISTFIVFTFLEIFAMTLFYLLGKDIKAFQYYPGRYQKSKDLGYELTPHWELDHDIIYEKFNSHGFRSPELKRIKPENHFRIVITGSSIVYGRTSNQKTISSILENKLNEFYGKTRTIEVINAGVPGYNSFHILRLFNSKLIDFSPDLIINYQFFTDLSIIDYGNNISKLDNNNIYEDSRFKKKLIKSTIDKSYILTMLKIAIKKNKTNLKTNSIKTDVVNLNTDKTKIAKTREKIDVKEKLEFFRSNMTTLANECEEHDINLLLCIPISLYKQSNTPNEIELIDNYNNKTEILESIGIANDLIKEISDNNYNAYYLDISKNIHSDISLFDDKYHTLEKGNQLVSEELKSFIVKNQLIPILND